jgi:hypothetical protein
MGKESRGGALRPGAQSSSRYKLNTRITRMRWWLRTRQVSIDISRSENTLVSTLRQWVEIVREARKN